MGRLEVKGVREIDGRLYFRRRVRIDGKRKELLIRLPGIDDLSFAEAYAKAQADQPTREAPGAGSMRALVIAFRAAMKAMRTKKGKPLAKRTVENYTHYLDAIEADHGPRLVRQMRRAHVYRIRDGMADRPGTANNYIAILRRLLEFGCERGWIDTNPAAGIPALALGEYQPWPARVLEAALAASSKRLRVALALGLCTGQRIGDCIAMQHGWHDWQFLEVRSQGKTGVAAAVPMHSMLVDELRQHERRAVTILYDRFGKPYSDPEPIQSRIRDLMEHPLVRAAIEAAAADGECEPDATFTFHGLRKNACCYLLETGESDAAVGGMLGMSPEMVRHYGKKKSALMIARGVADRRAGGTILPMPGERRSDARK